MKRWPLAALALIAAWEIAGIPAFVVLGITLVVGYAVWWLGGWIRGERRDPPAAPSAAGGYVRLADVVRLLRHVTTLDRVPGARLGLPEFHPLWDAAGLLEQEFGGEARAAVPVIPQGPFDPEELVRWAQSYGHPEEWAKQAQAAFKRVDQLEAAIRRHREAIATAGPVEPADSATAAVMARKHEADLDLWANAPIIEKRPLEPWEEEHARELAEHLRRSPFERPEMMTGYPLSPEEAEATRRVLEGGEQEWQLLKGETLATECARRGHPITGATCPCGETS